MNRTKKIQNDRRHRLPLVGGDESHGCCGYIFRSSPASRMRGCFVSMDRQKKAGFVYPSQEGIKYKEKKYAKIQLENQYC